MNHYSIKNGLLAGGASIILGLIAYLINAESFLTYGGWLSFVPVIYFMVKAATEYKDGELEGFLSFKEAFSQSWKTYFLYAVISMIFTYVMMNFVDPSLGEAAKQISIKTIEKMSGMMGEEGTAAAIEKIESEEPYNLKNIAISFLLTLVFPGALIALIIALIVKREKPMEF